MPHQPQDFAFPVDGTITYPRPQVYVRPVDGSGSMPQPQMFVELVDADGDSMGIPAVSLSASTPAAVGTSGSAGSDTAASKSDHVHDNGLEAWVLIQGGVGYQNSWVDYGGGLVGARYRRHGEMVYLGGFMKSGASVTVAFTLPAGYRPATADVEFPVATANAAGTNVVCNLVIASDGTCTVSAAAAFGGGGASFLCLDGVFFFTDA